MRILLGVLIALLCTGVMGARAARAQLYNMREYERQLDSEHVALTTDLNTFFGRRNGAGYTFVQPTVLLAARYSELVIEAAVPFSYLHENNDPGEDRDQFMFGNPWFGLAYLPDCQCGLSRLSLGLAIDAVKSETRLERQALSLARGAMGDWDGYLWVDETMPLVVGASTRLHSGILQLAWDGDLIFGLPGRGREFEFGTQHAGELAALFGLHWQLAGRISGVWYPTLDGDNFQSAASFFLRYMGVRKAVGARFVMNIDPPHGFAFTDEGTWGLGLFFSNKF